MATKNKKKNNNILKYIPAVIVGIIAFLVVFFLVQPPEKEQTATYRYTDNNGTTIEMTYYAKGDRVYKQTANNIIPYSALGVKSAEEAKEVLEDVMARNQGVKGYTDEIEYKKDVIIETVTVDYNVANIDDIKNLQGAFFNDGDTKNGISFKKSIELLEKNGFSKVEE